MGNSPPVMAYVIVIGSTQHIQTQSVVCSTLLNDFEHNHCPAEADGNVLQVFVHKPNYWTNGNCVLKIRIYPLETSDIQHIANVTAINLIVAAELNMYSSHEQQVNM